MAHGIIVTDPVTSGLWIFDCFGSGIRSRGLDLGLGLDNYVDQLDLAFNNVKPKDKYFVFD